MKKTLILLTITLALIASVLFCNGAFAEEFKPWNVQFEVTYGKDTYSYDLQKEITTQSDENGDRGFYLSSNKKMEIYHRLMQLRLPVLAVCNYVLPNFSKVVEHFGYVNQERLDSTVFFDKNGFKYQKGQDGVKINTEKLFENALTSRGRKIKLALPLIVDKAVTVDELKQNTIPKATFTTTYFNSGANRCFNIAKAVEALNGVTVTVGEAFSFNNTVGARTEERGYKTSKVILDGNYVEGVGGGVCQVSTTLYNALLLAGFIPHACQHSLVSTYVKAGFDAMVSYGASDLTFVNNTQHPIYIAATAVGKKLTFTIYGEPNVYRIERENVEERDKFQTVQIVDMQKYPELVYTDQTKIVTPGSDGVKTKSYLKYFDGDNLVYTKLIRQNSYKRVDQVIAHGVKERDLVE